MCGCTAAESEQTSRFSPRIMIVYPSSSSAIDWPSFTKDKDAGVVSVLAELSSSTVYIVGWVCTNTGCTTHLYQLYCQHRSAAVWLVSALLSVSRNGSPACQISYLQYKYLSYLPMALSSNLPIIGSQLDSYWPRLTQTVHTQASFSIIQ